MTAATWILADSNSRGRVSRRAVEGWMEEEVEDSPSTSGRGETP